MKCENCHVKPATVKLFKKGSPTEKKLCYHCEKYITTIDAYKNWTSQHLPYSSLKQSFSNEKLFLFFLANFDVSKSLSVSTLDSVLKSPILSRYFLFIIFFFSISNYTQQSHLDFILTKKFKGWHNGIISKFTAWLRFRE